VLNGDEGARTYRLAFHIPVPNEPNQVGVNLRTAVSQDAALNKTSQVPWITTAEQQALSDGELVEVIVSYTRPSKNTTSQDRDAIDTKYTAMVASVQDRIRDEYRFWGFDRDVP